MIGTTLSLAAGYLAMLEADLGNAQAAEAALAANRRLIDMAIRDLPPDSFARGYLPEFLGYYGYPTTGLGYGVYALPLAARDYENAAQGGPRLGAPSRADQNHHSQQRVAARIARWRSRIEPRP